MGERTGAHNNNMFADSRNGGYTPSLIYDHGINSNRNKFYLNEVVAKPKSVMFHNVLKLS